jgi:hypothetical protein
VEPAVPAAATPVRVVQPEEKRSVVPVGRLTAPNEEIGVGEVVTVTGEFEDDSRVTKVHFFAADESYRWTLIGTDAHSGNGTYSARWKVDYPPGSHLSLYAEAFDDTGTHAVDSISGLEGISVVGSSRPGTVEVRADWASELREAEASANTGPSFRMMAGRFSSARLALVLVVIAGLAFGTIRVGRRRMRTGVS